MRKPKTATPEAWIDLASIAKSAGKVERVLVSKPALLARINRALAKPNERLRASRPRDIQTQGEFYVIDLKKKVVVRYVHSLEKYARELKVLHPFEELEGF